MKGVIFTTLNEMVESRFGLPMWERLLATTCPASGGIYTGIAEYQDEELFSLVTQLSEETEIPVTDLVHAFGYYLFGTLASKYPMFLEQQPELFGFLDSIENVIHKEVRKLFDNPSLPSLPCQLVSGQEMTMEYSSPRKLCHLAIGLIEAAAERYGEKVDVEHERCIHEGADHCLFRIRKQ